MKFVIITKIPSRRGTLGPIPEKFAYDEAEADSIEEIQEGIHIPLNGEVLIIPAEHVTVVRSRLVNEVVSDGR